MKNIQKNVNSGPVEQNCHIVLGSDVLTQITLIQNMLAALKEGGFLFLDESKMIVDSKNLNLEKLGLQIISRQDAGLRTFLLLRKVKFVM